MSKSRSVVPLALSGPLAGSGPAGNRRLGVAALPVPITVMLVLVGVLALSLLPSSSSSSSSSDTPSRGSVLVRRRGDSMVGVGVGVGGGAGGGSARSSSIRSFTSNSTDPQTRTGFFIGTNPSEADVVLDGVPTAAFNDPNQPFTLPEVNNSFSLFLWATHVDGFSDDMTYNSTFDPDSSAPFWYNVADVQVYGRLWSSLYADTGALQIDVQISCWINGLQPVTVTLDIQSENEQIWYKRVVFYFQKQCTMPSFDVSVITSQSINRIIIANDFLGNYFSPAAAQIDTFLVGLNPNSTITQHGFRVQVYQPWWPQAAAVEVEANPASGFIFGLGDNAAVQIKVNYTCAEDQATNSTIDVLVSFDWIGGLYLGYTKECNTLKPSTTRTGFWIDDAEYDPIVYSGKPNERFTNPLQPFTLSEFNQSLIFNIYLSHVPGHSDQAFYNSTWQAAGEKIAQVTEAGKMASFIYAGAPAQRIALGFLCLRNGLQQLTLKLNIRDQPNLNPNYAQIVLYFQKQCQMPSFDVSVMSSSVITPQAIIVNNSRVAPGTGTGTDENWNYVSPTAVEADTFLIGLNNQSAVNEHTFTISNLKYDSKFVSVNVMPSTGFISGLGDSARVKIVVNYTCAANQTSNTTVSWILDYGWESQFAIEYTKMCDTFPPPFTTQAPVPPNPDSSTAWTTGAIAAFSAIILVFAFFLIGSLYKYIIQKKRGFDVIPGITLCRKCCGKCGSTDSDSAGQTLLDTQHEYVAPKERGGVNI